MKVIKTIQEIDIELEKVRYQNKKIGFIPTMGALHEGHLELVKKSVKQCDFTIASIYVNPTQFNNGSDLKKYPRNFDVDSEMLEQVGCDLLFCPNDKQMYPTGFQVLKMDLLGIDSVLEGEFRPGHFDGVVTIINRFFEIIDPSKAYFGEKDYQQLLIVKLVAKNFSSKIEIVPCRIEREKSGLAMSSRNRRLSDKQKKIAQALSVVLEKTKDKILSLPLLECENWAHNELKNVDGITLEYFKIVNQDSLKYSVQGENNSLRAFVAAEIGGVRLIDNMRL